MQPIHARLARWCVFLVLGATSLHGDALAQAGDAPVIGEIPDTTMPEDGTSTLVLELSDDGTAIADLQLRATSSNPLLIDATSLADGFGTAEDGARTLALVPLPDRYGRADITLEATDADGASSTRTFMLEVLAVNDAPALALQEDALVHVAGSSGAIRVPAFAQADPGPLEDLQQVQYGIEVLADCSQVLSGVTIDADGGLDYTLRGNDGTAFLRVVARDDGGTAYGGSDTTWRDVELRVGDGVSLPVRLDIVRNDPEPDAMVAEYDIHVTNTGVQPVLGLSLHATTRGLTFVQWACIAQPVGCTPDSGDGAPVTTFDVAPGATVRVQLAGIVVPGNFVEVTATLLDGELPACEILILDPVSGAAVFAAGFE